MIQNWLREKCSIHFGTSLEFWCHLTNDIEAKKKIDSEIQHVTSAFQLLNLN